MIAQRKFQQIAGDIKRLIKNGAIKEGDRLPSEKTLCQTYRVSRDTVREALEELKQQGYLRTVRGGGTFLQHGIWSEAGTVDPVKRIGIIVPNETDFLKEAYLAIVQAVEENGYECELRRNTDAEAERACIEYFIENRFDGIIISPLRNPYFIENATVLEAGQIPYVYIGDPIPEIFCDAVYFNDFYDAYLAVREFYRHNYDTVIHITDSVCERISVQNRKSGFIKGMQQFFKNNNIVLLDMSDPAATDKLRNILRKDVRLGILLYDDLIYGRIRPVVMDSKRKLIREVGILGYNDLEICGEYPEQLSSIHLPRSELGRRSFELLNMHLNFNISVEVSHILLKSNIIFRGTF